MIDTKVFNELMNNYVITQVGLNPNDYKNLDDLKNHGLVTSIGADKIYEDTVNQLINTENVIKKFLDDVLKGGNVQVPMDICLTKPLIIEKDVTIDLNGYTLTAPLFTESNGSIIEGNTDSYVFWVKNGTLTINGNGVVKSQNAKYSMAVWVNGGNAVLNGGTYINDGDGCDLIYLSSKGNLEIIDGTYEACERTGNEDGTHNKRSAINIKDANRSTCTVSVKGGKFLEFNPANNVSETQNTNFVAQGYESVKDGNYYIVKEVSDIIVDDNN